MNRFTKLLIVCTWAIFSSGLLSAQTLLTCSGSSSGAKVSLESISGTTITLRMDWDEGSTFAPANLDITNGTCQSCPFIGGIGRPHGTFQYWTIEQTDPNQAVSVAWATSGTINYCGGSTPAVVPGTQPPPPQTLLTCSGSSSGAKVSLESISGTTITLRMDWDEGSTFAPANLDITNGTCQSCPFIGGIGRPHGTFQYWTIEQTDPSQEVSVAWATSGTINYCGGSTPVTVPGTESGLEFVVGTETSGPNNTVIVPVSVNDFTDMATYQGTITFDPSILTFVSASNPQTVGVSSFGEPGQGTVPNNSITFSWYDLNLATQADGTIVMELEFTVAANASTGFTDIEIDGSATPLGYSTDPAASVLLDPTVSQGGVTIDADAPTVDVINIVSNNANDISFAKVGDEISLSFTTSETPDQTPVVTIVEGGAGAVTVSGSGTSYTATKTTATGGDGIVTFTIQIQDEFGNSTTVSATTDGSQVIVDTEVPSISCPGPIAQDTDAGVCGAVVNFSTPAGADNLPGHSVAQTAGPASGSTFPVGTTSITFTVTDAAGNTADCSFDITITDNEVPNVITQAFTVQLDANGNASITADDIDNGSSDDCGIDTRVLDISDFSCGDLGNNTVTLTVTDVNGNSASATAVVTVEDIIPPSITCPAPQTISTDAGLCTASLPDLTGLATVDDNCGSNGAVAIGPMQMAGGIDHTMVITNDGTIWGTGRNHFGQLGDGSGNTQSPSFGLMPNETDWVAVTAGFHHSLGIKGDGTLWAWGLDDNGQLGNGSSSGNQATPLQVGTDTDWTSIDAAFHQSFGIKSDGTLWAWGADNFGQLGNGSASSANVQIPEQIGSDTDWAYVSTGYFHTLAVKNNGSLWAWGGDNFGQLGNGAAGGQTQPVQIGSDTDWAKVDAGNAFSLAIKSDGSLWSWGSDVNGQLGNGSGSQADVDTPQQIGTDTDWMSIAAGGFQHALALKSDGTLWSWGRDELGELGNGSGSQADVFSPVQVGTDTDWASITTGYWYSMALKSSGDLFTWGYNFHGQLGNGSVGSASYEYSPFQTSITIASSGSNGSSLTVTQSPAAGTALAVGTHTVTITVADASGNSANCDVVITVEDNEDPTVVTQNITVQLDANGNASITASQIDNGSSDPCGLASVTVSPETFTCAEVGPNTVTLTVTDVNGNSETGTATVTVEDNVVPTVVTQDISVQLDAAGNASITAAQIDNGSSDNCSIATITVSPMSFTCAEVGANTVTLTVTDVNGNVETGTATVTVEDNVLPTVVTQNITVQLDAAGNASVTAAQVDNGSSDNCSIATRSVSPNSFTCAELGANSVTLTVTDVNGNVETGTATVTVEDNVLPTVVTQNVTVQLDAAGNASITATQIDNGSSDNCAVASVTVSPTSFDCSNGGANTVTLTVTDVNGNVETGTATVTVEDNVLPTVVTQDISVQLDAAGNASITAAQIDNGSSDNCSVASISLDITSFDCSNVGANSVVLTVTDANGNSETGTATVTVLDDPIISVSGKSVSEAGHDIPGVIYDLAGDDGPATQTGLSYNFLVAPCGSNNTIGGDKVDDAATNNGVDVQDAFDIVKHLLLIEQLGSPYKLIAADVNGTSTINVLDAFQVLRKINNIIPYFTNPVTGNQDAVWTFLPDDYVFADPLAPWGFETRRDILSPNADLVDEDFIGVKLGDVNNSWNPNQLRTGAPTDSMFLSIDELTAQQGDYITIPVTVQRFNDITGYQFTLNWDPSVLEFQEVNHQTLEGIYGMDAVASGSLTTAWVDMSGQSISLEDGTVAFELVFKAVGGIGSQTGFQIASDITPVKAYNHSRDLLGIGFDFNEININSSTSIDSWAIQGYSLDQNVPNPFAESTDLSFSLGKTEKVQMVIYSTNGQVIKRFDGTYPAGEHQIHWDGKTESGMDVSEGIYMVRLVAGGFTAAIQVMKNR